MLACYDTHLLLTKALGNGACAGVAYGYSQFIMFVIFTAAFTFAGSLTSKRAPKQASKQSRAALHSIFLSWPRWTISLTPVCCWLVLFANVAFLIDEGIQSAADVMRVFFVLLLSAFSIGQAVALNSEVRVAHFCSLRPR